MSPEVLKAIVARARANADPADSDDAIVAALGLAENIKRDLRENFQAIQRETVERGRVMAALERERESIQNRCPHVPGEWNYGYETRRWRECLICGKEVD